MLQETKNYRDYLNKNNVRMNAFEFIFNNKSFELRKDRQGWWCDNFVIIELIYLYL